jgi:hypothetical protein
MAGTGPRPPTGPGPHPGLVLQHAHVGQQPQLVPMQIQNPAHFQTQPGTFPSQIPLQHQRPMMNGLPPGAHSPYAAIQGNPQMMAARQQMQNMRLQPGALPPSGLTQLQIQQMQHQIHPQMQMQQLQAAQQANPAMRINPQHQVIPGQHLIQQQGIAGPIQHMGGQQVIQQLVPRYVYV